MFETALTKVTREQNLTAEESLQAFSDLLTQNISEAKAAAFLGALRGKGETTDEIVGCASYLRQTGIKLALSLPYVLDTCGTGGDNANTFNISTCAAFVAAGCGIPVAKHGNRAVSSRCGSADVLDALGIPADVEPALSQKALSKVGLTFLYAPRYHPQLKKMAPLRRQLGFKTIFNIAGPLANPVSGPNLFQIVGVFEKKLVKIVAEALKQLGVKKAWVIHSQDGLDEISIAASTHVAIVQEGQINFADIDPRQVGLELGSLETIRGADPGHNAQVIQQIFDGATGSSRDAVVLNAGAACVVANKASNLAQGVKLAQHCLDSGLAKKKYLQLKTFLEQHCSKVVSSCS